MQKRQLIVNYCNVSHERHCVRNCLWNLLTKYASLVLQLSQFQFIVFLSAREWLRRCDIVDSATWQTNRFVHGRITSQSLLSLSFNTLILLIFSVVDDATESWKWNSAYSRHCARSRRPSSWHAETAQKRIHSHVQCVVGVREERSECFRFLLLFILLKQTRRRSMHRWCTNRRRNVKIWPTKNTLKSMNV